MTTENNMPLAREIIQPKNDMLNVSRNFKLPHSPGIRAGDFIFLSGMVSVDPKTGERSLGTVYRQFFPKDPPARTTCGVQLSGGLKVEIECIALAG